MPMMGSGGSSGPSLGGSLDQLASLASLLSDPAKLEALRSELKAKEERNLALEQQAKERIQQAATAEKENAAAAAARKLDQDAREELLTKRDDGLDQKNRRLGAWLADLEKRGIELAQEKAAHEEQKTSDLAALTSARADLESEKADFDKAQADTKQVIELRFREIDEIALKRKADLDARAAKVEQAEAALVKEQADFAAAKKAHEATAAKLRQAIDKVMG